MARVETKKMVNSNIYNIFKALVEGFVKNDTNPNIDKYAQKEAERIKANETPNFIAGREKGVQDYSKTIPEEGRVVVKARVNEGEAKRTADKKAEEKSKQNGNSQKGIIR